MKFSHLTLFTLAILAYGIREARSARSPSSGCPDTDRGETQADCPWADLARTIAQKADAGLPTLRVIESQLPELFGNLKEDARRKAWLALWGNSINFDELAKGVIVEPHLIGGLQDLFGLPPHPPGISDGRVVHAGVEHTYGYLFSILKTSFGYKRARWVLPTLDRGFGLPEGTIAPLPKAGTLFANVTYFAGRIAFRNEPTKLEILDAGKGAVSSAVTGFDYGSLKPIRLEETVLTQEPGHTRTVRIRTDFVPFLKEVAGDSNTQLLIYSIDDPSAGGPRLITAFPVEKGFVTTALKPEGLGDSQLVIVRYNGYVEGLNGKSVTGSRRVAPPIQ